MSQKILLVGGAGYIGGCLTDMLVERGHDVTVYDSLLYESRFLKEVPFIFGDIRDTESLLKIHSKFDKIIWLAALVGDGACAQDPELTYEVNFHSVDRFLKATKRALLFPSTCSVYGAQDGVLDERSDPQPLSVYAETKLMAEKAVLASGGLAFRLGTLFGLGDHFSRLRLDLVVNVLTYKAMHDHKITVFGGDQWRPIIAVRDVAGHFVEAVEHAPNDVFNLGMCNVRIADFADTFKKFFPDLKVDVVHSKFEDLRNYRVSTEKAQKAFKYRPQITVEEEVGRMIKVLSERRIKDPLDPVYYNAHFVRAALESIRRT
jgi:nucleoside-diphosphate-sugar epimerase